MMIALATAALLGAPALPNPQTVLPSDSWLTQADSACEARDFQGLFEAFIYSPEVRRKYSAPVLEQRTLDGRSVRNGPAETPDDFTIAGVDFNYGDAASIRRWEAGEAEWFVRLNVERLPQPDGSVRVEYQPGEFVEHDEGDGSDFVRATGPLAAYVFTPSERCWRLTQHLR